MKSLARSHSTAANLIVLGSIVINIALVAISHVEVAGVLVANADESALASILPTRDEAAENQQGGGGGDDGDDSGSGDDGGGGGGGGGGLNGCFRAGRQLQSPSSSCNSTDFVSYQALGGRSLIATERTDFDNMLLDCARTCVIDASCTEACIAQRGFGFSGPCAGCMYDFNLCSLRRCLTQCLQALSLQTPAAELACFDCTDQQCGGAFLECTGFPSPATPVAAPPSRPPPPMPPQVTPTLPPLPPSPPVLPPPPPSPPIPPPPNPPPTIAYRAIGGAGDISFSSSLEKAFEGGAEVFGALILIFSGIWPYVKCLLLLLLWFAPMAARKRSQAIRWTNRLARWSLIDVYAIVRSARRSRRTRAPLAHWAEGARAARHRFTRMRPQFTRPCTAHPHLPRCALSPPPPPPASLAARAAGSF